MAPGLNRRSLLVAALAAVTCNAAHAGERLVLIAQHPLDIARPAETLAIAWSEVARALPGALLQQLIVRNAAGQSLPYQVTNLDPLARDPQGLGLAYGELLFQHDFAAGEQSARFTVEKSASVSPPFETKVFARFVPERLDDFAWENDKIAHRTYGAALAAPALTDSKKEVLVTSGIDVWFKRVAYPIIDRWYNKGHEHYHHDEGEGLDMYSVGRSCGAGGTGIWDGHALHSSRNYTRWKVIANGPIRAVFELGYDAWDGASTPVSETKRFTIDAGRYFHQIDSTLTFTGGQRLRLAVGLNKSPAYKERSPKVATQRLPAQGGLLQWVSQSGGDFGTALLLPLADEVSYAEDGANSLITTPLASGQVLRYYVGAIWSRAAEVQTEAAWREFVAAEAQRRRSPVLVTVVRD
jgi:pectinesterase